MDDVGASVCPLAVAEPLLADVALGQGAGVRVETVAERGQIKKIKKLEQPKPVIRYRFFLRISPVLNWITNIHLNGGSRLQEKKSFLIG